MSFPSFPLFNSHETQLSFFKQYNDARDKLVNFQFAFDEYAPFRQQRNRTSDEAKKAWEIASWYYQAKCYLEDAEQRQNWWQVSDNDLFKRLLNQWQQHAELADYTVSALIALDSHLASNISCLQKGQRQLRNDWLRNFFNPFKKNFSLARLRELKTKIEEEINHNKLHQAVIIDAMLARLQLASNTYDIANDDIIYYVFKSAKEQGIIHQHYSMPAVSRRGLNQSAFMYFHQAILTRGTAKQRNILSNCYWYHTHRHYLIPIEYQAKFQYPLPRYFQQQIPSSLIAELFYPIAEINGLFQQAQTNLNVPICFNSLSKHPAFMYLSNCLTALEDLSRKLPIHDKTMLQKVQFLQHNRAVRRLRNFFEQEVKNKIYESYLQFFQQVSFSLQILLKRQATFTYQEVKRVRITLAKFEIAFGIYEQHVEYINLKTEITDILRAIDAMHDNRFNIRDSRSSSNHTFETFKTAENNSFSFATPIKALSHWLRPPDKQDECYLELKQARVANVK